MRPYLPAPAEAVWFLGPSEWRLRKLLGDRVRHCDLRQVLISEQDIWLPLGPCVWLLIGLLHLWRSTYFRWGHHLLTTSRFPHYYHPPSSDACFCSGRQLQLGTVSGLSFLPVCLSCLLGPNIRLWCSMYPDGTHSIFHCCDQEPTQFWRASDPGVSTLRVALGMKASISDSKREGFDVTCDQAAGPTRPGWKVLVVVLLICNTLLCLFVRGWLH